MRNLKFRKINNNLQNQIRQIIKDVKTSKEVVIPADKSNNWYKIPIPLYKKLVKNVVTKDYQYSSENEISKVNMDSLDLVRSNEAGLETRVEVLSRGDAFILVKDQKPTFPSKLEVRLINPSKPPIGKISKEKLQEINSSIRSITKLNQLQSTNDAISWFKGLKYKNQRHFLIFDVIEFYPSISKFLLKKTFEWARCIVKIPKADEELVFMARRSFLFLNSQPWVKKEEPAFDVTMGAFDGAEVAEFVGLYLLSRLSLIMNLNDFALYRDDGICAIRGTKRSVNEICKKIEEIFKETGLKVDIPPTGPTKLVNFLDLNLNLSTGYYALYRKPLTLFLGGGALWPG